MAAALEQAQLQGARASERSGRARARTSGADARTHTRGTRANSTARVRRRILALPLRLQRTLLLLLRRRRIETSKRQLKG